MSLVFLGISVTGLDHRNVTREKERVMMKRALLISLVTLLLTLPLTALAANFGGKVYENGTNNNPIAVPDVKVEVFGGYGFKALFSSAMTGSDGGCILKNIPLGKEVLVKLTKPGYVTQFDIRSYSEADAEKDVILWIGSELDINNLFTDLGVTFDVNKGHVYLDISSEFTGEGIGGVQLVASSGKVFDFGNGEYLIANAEGSSLKVGIQKPGYDFDIESATIPLYAGAMTQYYVNVQSGGGISGSAQGIGVTIPFIAGRIVRVSDSAPISGVSVAFTDSKKITVRPAVYTDKQGYYIQTGFPFDTKIAVTPSSISATTPQVKSFSPAQRWATIKAVTPGAIKDFKARGK